ncbi:MAG TPA: redoxin domain-containing protein [Terriglobales bacterium]|nr:redoxin domain-containing protein [Terriglobales bacterium]
MSTAQSYPLVDQMIPDFRLESLDGREFRMANFRGHRNLVLVFTAGATLPLVAELASRTEELEQENARVFLIAAARSERLEAANAAGFPVLLDADRKVSRRFGAENAPALYVTDQYGEIYSAHHGARLPSADEVLSSLRHISAACPE